MATSRILTHMNVDFDACASVWVARKFLVGPVEVAFVPANFDAPDLADYPVDLNCGIKGEASAFSDLLHILKKNGEVPEPTEEFLRRLARYLDVTDTGRPGVSLLVGVDFTNLDEEDALTLRFVSLSHILFSLKRGVRGTAHDHQDHRVVKMVSTILDGMLEGFVEERNLDSEIEEVVEWRSGGQVAIARDPKSVMINRRLFARGARFVIFQDGNNLGIVRRDDQQVNLGEVDELTRLVSDEAGWFFHPAGFLAARGTRKAPATEPSRFSASVLAEIVEGILG